MFAQSLQREYRLCSSLDPALDLPEVPQLGDSPSQEEIEAHRDASERRSVRFRNARDHDRWHEITRSGEKLTFFKLRPVHGPALVWLHGEAVRKTLTHDELFLLAFRLALREIENFGQLRVTHEKVDGIEIASLESLREWFEVGASIGKPKLGIIVALEIGAHVYGRATEGVPPLS